MAGKHCAKHRNTTGPVNRQMKKSRQGKTIYRHPEVDERQVETIKGEQTITGVGREGE